MPASQGTPTVFDKIRVGIQAIFGKNPGPGTPDAATLQGDLNDLHASVDAVETLFGPVVQEIESDAVGDVATFIKGVAALIPSINSVSKLASVVQSVAAVEAGPVNQQITALSQGALATLASAALVATGKLTITA